MTKEEILAKRLRMTLLVVCLLELVGGLLCLLLPSGSVSKLWNVSSESIGPVMLLLKAAGVLVLMGGILAGLAWMRPATSNQYIVTLIIGHLLFAVTMIYSLGTPAIRAGVPTLVIVKMVVNVLYGLAVGLLLLCFTRTRKP